MEPLLQVRGVIIMIIIIIIVIIIIIITIIIMMTSSADKVENPHLYLPFTSLGLQSYIDHL